MLALSTLLSSATMGNPKRLRPMIAWTVAEYFFRGAPYGVTLIVVWELFKPLENPSTTLNIGAIVWALVALMASLVILFLVSRKAYLASFTDGYQICCDGRLSLVNQLRQLPMGYYNSHDPGDIGAHVVTDYTNIEQTLTHLLPQFFGALAMPIIALVSSAFYCWQLALAAALVIPLAYPAVLLTNFLVAKFGKKHQKVKVETASRMIEYIQGIRLIKAFNIGGAKFERLENAFRRLKTESIRLESAPGPSITFSSIVLNGGLVLIMLLGFSMLLDAHVSLPVYIMFLIIGMYIYQPLIHAMTFMAEMNYSNLGIERIEMLRQAPLLKDGFIGTVPQVDVEFCNVHFSYNDTPVINGISLSIPAKSLTALVGPSGSGKTTLTRLIARFWDVNEGEIRVGGINIKDYKIETLMAQIAIVFQDVYLFNDTIYNNILVGKENATKEEVIAAAKAAQCHDFITAFPQGYGTMVGEGGSTLSGGEKQRISIARAILKDAPIVLLDEATASLDPENEQHIQQAIGDLVKNKTVIVIAHRLNTISGADKIVVIDKGKVVQQGLHTQLLSTEGLYRSLWNEQQRAKGWKF